MDRRNGHGARLVLLVAVGLGVAACKPDASPPPAPTPALEPATQPAQLPMPDRTPVDDPTTDGWQTEVFNDQVSKQLKRIAAFIDGKEVDIADIPTDDFACRPLLPTNTRLVYSVGSLQVERAETESKTTTGFVEAMSRLRDTLRGGHVKFKLYRVEPGDGVVVTRQYFSARGKGRETHMTWACTWTPDGKQLRSIESTDFEQSSADSLFIDDTPNVIGHTDAYREQLAYSSDHWWRRIQTVFDIDMDGHQGIAVGDVDGDGLEDIYVCQTGGMPNRLFRHRPDGTVEDISAAAGVDWMERTSSALLIDIDNDGDQDLVAATSPDVLMMENDGTGRFKTRTVFRAGANTFSMAAADYDNDGDLDLYICIRGDNRAGTASQVPLPIPYHNANNGGSNFLLRNDGDWQFTDVTRLAGLNVNNRKWTFAAAWEDYDNDGDMDLYVANDFGFNNLYRNDDGKFTDVAAAANARDQASGMSICWGDYNRDGRMDFYVSNMFSSAGNRTTFQPQYQPGASTEVKAQIQRMARGNSLFRGGADAAGRFTDVSEPAAATMGRWAWASKFIDINNDGWEDLVVTNGYLTRDAGTKDL